MGNEITADAKPDRQSRVKRMIDQSWLQLRLDDASTQTQDRRWPNDS